MAKRETYLTKLSGEEKEAHYSNLRKKIAQKKEERRNNIEEQQRKAKELIPHLLAQQIIEQTHGDSFTPTVEMRAKLREIVEMGMTLSEARKKFFADVPHKIWDKLTVSMYKDSVPNKEALGIDIVAARTNYIKSCKKQIADLEKQLRAIRRDIKEIRKDVREAKEEGLASLSTFQKNLSDKNMIYSRIIDQVSRIREKMLNMELEVGESMKKMDLIGEKAANTHINFNVSLPRPKNKIKDVSPKIKLDDIL